MLTRAVDTGLGAAFVAADILSRLRIKLSYSGPITQEEDRLIEEWLDCHRQWDLLQAEVAHPSFSRRFDAQIKLWKETQAEGDRCHNLLVELRRMRKIRVEEAFTV